MAAPFEITLGLEWDYEAGRLRLRPVVYRDNRHITLFGPTRSGKGVCLEIPALLRLGSPEAGGPLSIINIDPRRRMPP